MNNAVVDLIWGITMTAMSVTQCDQQDTSDWLIVDNNTDECIVITVTLQDGVSQVTGFNRTLRVGAPVTPVTPAPPMSQSGHRKPRR